MHIDASNKAVKDMLDKWESIPKHSMPGIIAEAAKLGLLIAEHKKNQHEAGVKLDTNKPDVDLVFRGFPRALLAVAEVATFGAKKYTPDGWREVENAERRYSSAMDRHRLHGAIEECCEESNLLHDAHIAWNALARLELKLDRLEKEKGQEIG